MLFYYLPNSQFKCVATFWNTNSLYIRQSLYKKKNGKTFDQIAEQLNQNGYLSVRGKKFKGNHIHSFVKKKRLKDEQLERQYPKVWSDFSLEVFDKILVNKFED